MKCPYCGSEAECVDPSRVYGNKKYKRGDSRIWVCKRYPECDSYVGCHPDSSRPLGPLANKELRIWRIKAHAAFDPIWQSGRMKRKDAYRWLSKSLNIKHLHIGQSDAETCERICTTCYEARNGSDSQLSDGPSVRLPDLPGSKGPGEWVDWATI